MLTRYSESIALKNWALDIARRSTMRKARVALARSVLQTHTERSSI
jgi:transposase